MWTGLENLLANPSRWLGKARAGMVTNPTAVDRRLRHAVDLLVADDSVALCRLFGPEHGVRGTAQEMVDVGDTVDPSSGLPVVSLYGTSYASLAPQPETLADLDVLLFDIQDIGARYYTYQATLALCMRVAARVGTKVLVLDRPNPIGGVQVEGGGIAPGLESFCGLYPIPQRHGLTVGELARLYNEAFALGCELDVVPCSGWERHLYFDAFDVSELPWVMPSPNMPTLDTALVYPGMCLLEGTNLSEGRGTTRPFELFGAPFINAEQLAAELIALRLPGVAFRVCTFEPTFHKWQGELCAGLQLYVTNRETFNAYQTGLAVLWAVKKLWPEQFGWRAEPYEFRDDVPAIDLLTGFPEVREAIDAGRPYADVLNAALHDTEQFDAARPEALMY